MFWSKKEDKKSLPDLPPLKHPRIIDGAGESFNKEVEKHELPSFPDNLTDKGFSQAAIKGAVSGHELETKTVEMKEWEPESFENRGTEEMSSNIISNPPDNENRIPPVPYNLEKNRTEFNAPNKNKDIFVKLDKFYSARRSLIDIQQNLEDIEELLKKIREIKMREEQELSGWESELENIKARLNNVTVNLFEKID